MKPYMEFLMLGPYEFYGKESGDSRGSTLCYVCPETGIRFEWRLEKATMVATKKFCSTRSCVVNKGEGTDAFLIFMDDCRIHMSRENTELSRAARRKAARTKRRKERIKEEAMFIRKLGLKPV